MYQLVLEENVGGKMLFSVIYLKNIFEDFVKYNKIKAVVFTFSDLVA